jgi:hypothetical protein
MNVGKTILILLFALLGFIIGNLIYLIYWWFDISSFLTAMSISEIILSPWFLSGIGGSALAVSIIFAFTHLSSKK